ncbi:MAG: cytochrome c3 family protein [Thermoleophilia bacterium]|nr:cytochrome c3 family protein [Thermoleophilia bacterium]
MRSRSEGVSILLLSALALAVLALLLTGCESADETTTTASSTETTVESTETTASTAPGEATTSTTGGAESVAPVSESFKICTDCHSDFNQFLVTSKVLTKNFGHALHLNKGFKCEDCHAVPTHKPDQIVKPTMQACFTCHGQEESSLAPGACSSCHPADFALVPANHSGGGWLPAANPGVVKTVTARHPEVALQDRSYCDMCHAASFCDACHKTPMPHASDWQTAHPQTVKSQGQQTCAQCHPAQYLCNDCHHTGYKPGTPWKQQHPPIVKTGGAEGCFTCHNPLTCAHCHVTGEFQQIEPTQ